MKPIRKQIAECLRHVDDPEIGVNIVDLGLVYGLRFEEGDLTIKLTMTTPACPLSDYIKRNIRQVMARWAASSGFTLTSYGIPRGPRR